MNPTRNSLAQKTRRQSIDILQPALVTLFDLYSQVKQAHWTVRGPNFIGLHELFDKIAGEVLEHLDEVAERIAQLGGTPIGTARASAAMSALEEYPIKATASVQHVKAVSDRLAHAGALIRSSIDAADKAGDADTADLFTQISRSLDKSLWFVEAHLLP